MIRTRAAPTAQKTEPHEPFARWNRMVQEELKRQARERTRQEEPKPKTK